MIRIVIDADGNDLPGYLSLTSSHTSKFEDTKEVVDGAVLANYAADGTLIGVELLGPCNITIRGNEVCQAQ